MAHHYGHKDRNHGLRKVCKLLSLFSIIKAYICIGQNMVEAVLHQPPCLQIDKKVPPVLGICKESTGSANQLPQRAHKHDTEAKPFPDVAS